MGKDSQGWLSPYIEVVKATSKNLETTCGVSQGWLSPYTEVVKETSKNLETICGDFSVIAVAIHKNKGSGWLM